MLTIHAVMTLLALLLLRVAVQIALLHEAHDPVSFTDPLLCVHCEHVVPDMAFCPACGAATGPPRAPRARGSQAVTSGAHRRHGGTVSPATAEAEPELYPGYALPPGTYAARNCAAPGSAGCSGAGASRSWWWPRP